MSDYTPTTGEHRRLIVDAYGEAAGAAFDRWLRQVKAEAWKEGHTAGELNSDESLDDEFEYIENPYV